MMAQWPGIKAISTSSVRVTVHPFYRQCLSGEQLWACPLRGRRPRVSGELKRQVRSCRAWSAADLTGAWMPSLFPVSSEGCSHRNHRPDETQTFNCNFWPSSWTNSAFLLWQRNKITSITSRRQDGVQSVERLPRVHKALISISNPHTPSVTRPL